MIRALKPEMSEAEYRAHPGLNFSALKHMAVSPKEFQYQLTRPHEPTPEMMLGLVCERIVFFNRPDPYVCDQTKPEGLDGRSKEGREWHQANRAWQTEQEAKGCTIVSPAIFARAQGAASAVKDHPDSRELLDICLGRQVAWFAPSEDIQKKGLIDLLPPSGGIVDFKTAFKDAIPQWSKLVYERDYDAQAAFYLDGASEASGAILEQFWHIVVESEPPHDVLVRPLSDAFIGIGRHKYTRWLEDYAACLKSGKWGGVPTLTEVTALGPVVPAIEPPSWILKKHQQRLLT